MDYDPFVTEPPNTARLSTWRTITRRFDWLFQRLSGTSSGRVRRGLFNNRSQGANRGELIVMKEEDVITIRRLRTGEVDLFKQLRLTALRDAPYAFPSTYEAALNRSAESWREQAEGTARGNDRATFIAFSDDVPVGMAALYRREGQVDEGELLQVWVSPDYRGTRLAWDLMDACFQWADENSFRTIIAGVTKGNARALKFYINYGFSITEETSTGVYVVKEV